MRNCKKKNQINYCCNAKQYYSNETENLIKTLKISPRLLIYKKSLKTKNIYESIINVTNNGLHERLLIFSTDSLDTTISVYPTNFSNNFLPVEKSLQISVRVQPKYKTKLNLRRHIFIDCKHPNIKFTIPIIILNKNDVISIPTSIAFPSTTVSNFTYYEMLIYNMSSNKQQFNIKSHLPMLTVHTKSSNILRKDYAKVLLKLNCSECNVFSGVIKLKLSTGDSFDIAFSHEPIKCPMFLNVVSINFDAMRFNHAETRKFNICNESNNDIVFIVDFITAEEILEREQGCENLLDHEIDSELNECKNNKIIDKYPNRHFQFKPICGTIAPNSSYIVEVTFKPVIHKDFEPPDECLSPFMVSTELTLRTRGELCAEKKFISLKGYINGPDIELLPRIIDFRHVYYGEEHCAQIQVINLDDTCEAYVNFHNIISPDTGQVLIKPENGLVLKPQQKDIFKTHFYSTEIGKFMVKLEFKVRYGGLHSIVIKGFSQKVRVKCFPEVIDLGAIPIAVPQKRLVLLTNPLTVPITVQCTVRDDGYETPLVLNVCNINESLPINVNDPVYHLMNALQTELYQKEEIENKDVFEIQYSPVETAHSLESFNSVIEENSTYSTEFEELILENIPDISHTLISQLKTIKVVDKLEAEKIVAETALKALLETPYFLDMENYKNYVQMDWNSLASDPQEVYCNDDIILIKPNAVKIITIVVIPNIVGFQRKYIDMRVCPIMTTTCIDKNSTNVQQIVDTNEMVSKLWLKYNCSVPEVIWDNIVTMQGQLYAGEYYEFPMLFENTSNIGGFFYYDVVPNSNLGTMKFTNNMWKYFIEPETTIQVPCKVKFKKLGFVTLAGLIKFVGICACYTFQIKSEVLPPKVRYSPKTMEHTINVLEFTKLFLFIENATPTTTWFRLKLSDESVISIEPHGAQLAPTGQSIYVTFNVFYRDPGTYKNVLYIIMEFETIEKIPITLHVKGMPLFFEPQIRNEDLDIGYVLCNTEEDYMQDKPNFFKTIKVINKGLRFYRLIITRTKSSDKQTCRITALKSKITVKPTNFIISPLSETYFTIIINCCEASSLYSEHRIDAVDLSDIKRAQTYRFSLRAEFIMPKLTWNRKEITIDYYRTHKHKEQDQWEIIKLTNVAQITVESVNIKIIGPFKIKELFEHQFQNELNFSIAGLETKQFFVMLDKSLIRNHTNTLYEGRIFCCANSRLQKSVPLRVKMFIPEITLKYQQVTLFTNNTEGGTLVEIKNTGEIPVIYKWKKLKEEWHDVNEEDDCQQVASIILSDIIRMLELQHIDIENDSETNMTRRYQKYRCLLKDIDDPIGIKEILYDIIEHIDLTGRRYKLCYDKSEEVIDGFEIEDNEIEIISSPSSLTLNALKTEINEAILPTISEKEYQDNLTEAEENCNSDTIYLNKKFSLNNSTCTVASNQYSNEETCVFYTLDHIMTHLKLEDSYILSSASSETCEHIKSVYFYEKCGLLQVNEKHLCALHIPPIRKGFEVRATFQLGTVGGKSHNFEIILVNLEKTIVLSKNNIYLGLKPWYETYRSKVDVQNITNYDISLKIIKDFKPYEKLPRTATGYLKLMGDEMLHLKPYESCIFETMGIMGFNEEFKRDLRLIINDGEELIVSFKGHGAMPMITNCKPKLKLADKLPHEIIEEYLLLQKIYYFDIFKAITEKEDNLQKSMNEEEGELKQIKSFLSDITLLSTETEQDSEESRSTIATEKELRFFKLLQTYVLVNNNEDLPNSDVLDQLLQTEKFLNRLRCCKELNSLLNLVYQNYLQHEKFYNTKVSTNLKHFTIQPLPYHLTCNILDMGKLYLNQYRRFVLQFEFMGPGKLKAACRSAVKIPGLMLDFGIVENTGNKDFVFYRNEEKSTDLCDKPYRNINERQLDAERDPKVKHAHSYDITPLFKHQRDTTNRDRKWLRNYYDSLNKSIYMEQKYHVIHCKIFTNCNYNFSGTKIKLILLFRPQRVYYKHNQKIEDYLYIDLHMGPTLPILLKGVIIEGNRSETTTSSSLST